MASTWSGGLANGKLFMKLYKQYQKSHHKPAKLMPVDAPLQGFIKFLCGTGRKEAASLWRLRLQCAFLQQVRERGCLGEATEQLVAGGLVKSWLASEKGNPGPRAELWLRSLLHGAVVRDLEGLTMVEEGESPSVALMHDDVLRVYACLSRVSEEHTGNIFRALADDAHSLRVLLSGWDAEEVDIDLLCEARRALDTDRMRDIMEALKQTQAGTELLSRVAKAMQASGKDAAGDERLSAAFRLLHDHRAPAIGGLEDSRIITQLGDIRRHTVVRLFEEVLTLIMEAIALWSRVRSSKKGPEVTTALEELMQMMLLVDQAATLDLLACIKASGVFGRVMHCPQDPAAWLHADERLAFGSLSDLLTTYSTDDPGVRDFVQRVRGAMSKLPEACLDPQVGKDMDEKFLVPMEDNAVVRDDIVQVLSLVSGAIRGENLLATTFVEEYMRSVPGGSAQRSRLHDAVQLGPALREMTGMGFQYGSTVDATFLMDVPAFVRGAPVPALRVNVKELNDFLSSVLNAPVVRRIASVVESSASEICGMVTTSAGVACLKLPPRSVADKNLQAAVEALLIPATSAQTVASTILNQAQQASSVSWPCDHMTTIALALVEDLRERQTPVNARGLCALGAPPVVHVGNPAALPWVFRVYVGLGKLAAVFGHVHASHLTTSQPFTSKGSVLPSVDLAVRISNAEVERLDHLLSEQPDLEPDASVVWLFPLDKVQQWHACAKQLLAGMQLRIVQEAVAAIGKAATGLQKIIPPHEGLFSTAAFNVKMAHDHLVLWPSRPQLHKGCKDLFAQLQDISRIYASWNCPTTLLSLDVCGEELKSAYGILEAARRSLRIIAGVNALHQMSGKEQRDSVEKVLSKKDGLPKNLLAALEKIR